MGFLIGISTYFMLSQSMKNLLVVWLFLWLCWPTMANDFEWNSSMQKAYSQILKMKLSSGRAILDTDKNNNGIKYYLQSYADLVQLLVTENKGLYHDFLTAQETRLEAIDALDKKSPYRKFLQAEIKLHSAFVKLKFGHEVKGSLDIIKAYKLLESNQKAFPNFLPQQKSLGLLHILIGSTPESYLWVTNLLGLRGNISQGIHELNSATKDPIFKDESLLIQYLVHAYILTFNTNQLSSFEEFISNHPDNLLFYFLGVTTFMKEGKSENASQLLNQCETLTQNTEYIAFPFLDYLQAEIALQKGLYPTAIKAYQGFLQQYKGFNFVKDSYYKLFLCYWLLGDDSKARPYLEKVRNNSTAIVEADKYAGRFAENFLANDPKKPISQKVLMKARLAFDGGFYEKADNILEKYTENSFDQLSDKAEFNYRKARILQKIHEENQAIIFFERAISLSEDTTISFGATSSLQLGYIWLEKGNKLKAKKYFEKALSYKKHEYKNSIDNKAKAALNENF